MTTSIPALEQQIVELKQQLAEAKRTLPPTPVKDYTLHVAPSGAPVKLSELFGAKRDLIVVHNMGRKCPYCTLWADGFAGLYKHLADRAAFVLMSPDEPAVAGAFASSRHWTFQVVSIAGSTFGKDMGFQRADGGVSPGASGYHKNADGTIVRTGVAEQFGPGDAFCSLWHFLDLLQDGAAKWEPKYHY